MNRWMLAGYLIGSCVGPCLAQEAPRTVFERSTVLAGTGTITFAAGDDTETVMIRPSTDGECEPDETVELCVVAGPGYGVGDPDCATGTIRDCPVVGVRGVAPLSVCEDDDKLCTLRQAISRGFSPPFSGVLGRIGEAAASIFGGNAAPQSPQDLNVKVEGVTISPTPE